MDGLILLIILIPVVFLFLLITILSRSGEQRRLLESLYDKIKQLSNEVSSLSKELKENKETPPLKPVFKEAPAKTIIKEEPIAEQPVIEKEIIKDPVVIPKQIWEEKIVVATPSFTEPGKEELVDIKPVQEYKPGYEPEKETDIEKFIGENLANKIGIAVLVLGIAFFIKYAIDKNWINETGRVIIGLISGSILIGLAHYYRNSYRSFSSVLVGGGLSVFYFSIAFAFHQYHLIGQLSAFIAMVVVSAFAVVLSLFYNRQELAILATIGGFITPFLVSTGQENYVALFTYLCILNAGLIALSWFKRWPAINIISLFFTTIIFSGWLIKRISFDNTATFPSGDALLFSTLFYLLFVVMNIINSIRLKNKFTSFDFIILLSINFLYYAAGIIILEFWNEGNAKGLFALSLGVFNLLLTAIFYHKKSADRNFVSLLMGLSLTFISLTAPVLLKGNHIVLFWAAEAVLLFFLYQRSKIILLKIASGIVIASMLISLVLTWIEIYFTSSNAVPVIVNKGFITTLAAAAALFIYHRLMRKEQETEYIFTISTAAARNLLLTKAISILYLSGVLELYYQFSHRYTEAPVHSVYLQAYSFAFALILLQVFKKRAAYSLLKFVLTLFCFGFYLVNIAANHEVSLALLSGTGNNILFGVHWFADVLLLWLLYDLIRFFFKKTNEQWAVYRSPFTWIAATGIILLLSIEMYHIILWANYQQQNEWAWWRNLYQKAGLSILWSSCSFTMMWLGMKHGFRTLRIISLTLFTITLVKLFLFDIRNIPPGGKIAAFILLGVLLLVVSFMYQRLKKILIDDTGTN
ncbi:MAG: DUF2339 domain-containing protein [Chitinophagaceae bacterium]